MPYNQSVCSKIDPNIAISQSTNAAPWGQDQEEIRKLRKLVQAQQEQIDELGAQLAELRTEVRELRQKPARESTPIHDPPVSESPVAQPRVQRDNQPNA